MEIEIHTEFHGRELNIFNPMKRELEKLPVIFGFINGGHSGWYTAVAISSDGFVLGQHVCSHQFYMPADLCLVGGIPNRRHDEDYSRYYPNGYRCEVVLSDNIRGHQGLMLAVKVNTDTRDQLGTLLLLETIGQHEAGTPFWYVSSTGTHHLLPDGTEVPFSACRVLFEVKKQEKNDG